MRRGRGAEQAEEPIERPPREGRWFIWLVIVLAVVVVVDDIGLLPGADSPSPRPPASVLGEVITRESVLPSTAIVVTTLAPTPPTTVAPTTTTPSTTTAPSTTTTRRTTTTTTTTTEPTTTTESPTTTTTIFPPVDTATVPQPSVP